jgi:hypothetical protein
MAVNIIESTAATRKLVAAFIAAKETEQKAKEKRLEAEGKLFDAIKTELPEKGSARIENVKITCGSDDKWDQEILQSIRKDWPKSYPNFPFKEELKPIGGEIAYLKKNVIQVYDRLKPALEVKDKKPSFEIE